MNAKTRHCYYWQRGMWYVTKRPYDAQRHIDVMCGWLERLDQALALARKWKAEGYVVKIERVA